MAREEPPAFDAREVLGRATADDWGHVFAEVDLLAREGRWAALGQLREACGERSAKPLVAVRERIENRAAENAAGARALAGWTAAETIGEERLGELADRLAQAHAWPAIAAAGFRDDLLLLAANARVLRREDLAGDAAAAGAARRATERGDPLGALPLTPLPLERSAWLPSFSAGGATWSLPFGGHIEGLSPVVTAESHLDARGIERSALPAFAHWAKAAAATGRPAGAASPAAAAGAFAALLPEAAREAGAVRVREVSESEAWAYVFCAALAGDAAPRRSAGRARLAAWETFAALAGTASLRETERALGGTSWYVLDAPSAWFGGKARDAALAGRLATHWCAVAATEKVD